jgi:hypothetical protein
MGFSRYLIRLELDSSEKRPRRSQSNPGPCFGVKNAAKAASPHLSESHSRELLVSVRTVLDRGTSLIIMPA